MVEAAASNGFRGTTASRPDQTYSRRVHQLMNEARVEPFGIDAWRAAPPGSDDLVRKAGLSGHGLARSARDSSSEAGPRAPVDAHRGFGECLAEVIWLSNVPASDHKLFRSPRVSAVSESSPEMNSRDHLESVRLSFCIASSIGN